MGLCVCECEWGWGRLAWLSILLTHQRTYVRISCICGTAALCVFCSSLLRTFWLVRTTSKCCLRVKTTLHELDTGSTISFRGTQWHFVEWNWGNQKSGDSALILCMLFTAATYPDRLSVMKEDREFEWNTEIKFAKSQKNYRWLAVRTFAWSKKEIGNKPSIPAGGGSLYFAIQKRKAEVELWWDFSDAVLGLSVACIGSDRQHTTCDTHRLQ